MSAEWYKEQPKNRNFLNPVGFLLKLQKFEGVDFFCQSANLPDISMPVTQIASKFRNLPIIPGGGVDFGDLTVTFIVDEELLNYASIHKWIRDNGNADKMQTSSEYPEYSNSQLHILTSNYNTNHIVEYRNIFPYSLTQMQFDATVNDVDYLTATVTFKFQEMFLRDESFKLL
jgi:hypothetical protein